jgi:hypothetical protein
VLAHQSRAATRLRPLINASMSTDCLQLSPAFNIWRFKQTLCSSVAHKRGRRKYKCPHGANCWFAHSLAEKTERMLPPVCVSYLRTGVCLEFSDCILFHPRPGDAYVDTIAKSKIWKTQEKELLDDAAKTAVAKSNALGIVTTIF